MKSIQSLLRAAGNTIAGCALLALPASSLVRGDEWDKKTLVTFSAPVEIPGQVLQAGTYTFRLLDSPSNRYIVQISNERQNHVYATILAIPSYRMKAPDETLFTFYEAPSGQPQPIRAWFYPGDSTGREFPYPKSRGILASAKQTSEETTVVAQASPSSVPAAPTVIQPAPASEDEETASKLDNRSSVAISDEVSGVTAMKDERDTGSAIAAEEVQQEPVPPAADQPATPASTDQTMPKTASQLAAYGLLGLVALSAACGLRLSRRS